MAKQKRQGTGKPDPTKDRTAHEAARGPGKKKREALKHPSKHDPDDKEFDEAVNELQSGSDRVAAIMGAALIENTLLDAIAFKLKDASDTKDLFYDQGAPFGTFRARIVGGKALGLYGKQMADDLHRIRDIRNQFAHALLSLTFDHPYIVHVVSKIEGPYNYREGGSANTSAARTKFETACWSISLHIMRERNMVAEVQMHALKELNRKIADGLKGAPDNLFRHIDPD